MTTKIKCPYCQKSFEPNEAFKHELEETAKKKVTEAVRQEVEEKVKQELVEKGKQNTKLQEQLEDKSKLLGEFKEEKDELLQTHKKELEEIKKQIAEQAKAEAKESVTKELKDKEDQIGELKVRAEKAEAEELKIRKEKRVLKGAKERFELEKERQLDEERERIRKTAVDEIQEKDRLKFAEYEKKLKDMSVALEDAKRKGEQVSQQLQGEVLELDFENLLEQTFPDDEIVPIGKGAKGGDIIQKVKSKSGRVAGVILWETKRAKWSPKWTGKLREDARSESATFAILLSTNLPPDITDFKLIGGVIVCSYKSAIPLASVLRRSVLYLAVAKQTAANKDENLELLYDYLQSESFRHRFEAFAEGVSEMQNDLDYEKRAMERVWKKREVQIKKTLLNASRMYGELQGVMGNALPDIKTFSLPQGDEKESS